MLRNFWKLIYVTLPAALVMAFAAFLYKPSAEAGLIVGLFRNEFTMSNYQSRLLNTLTVLRYGKYWWVFAIGLTVLVLAECVAVVKIDRHMRTGQMPALPMKRAFGIFPIMLCYALCCFVASELGSLVAVGLSVLMKFVGNATAIVSLTLVLLLALKAVGAYVFCLLLISFPLKYSENYRFNRAMSYSARMMFRKKRVLWGTALLYPLLRLAVLALAYLLESFKLDVLVYAVAFVFVASYVPCFSYKQYYDDVGGERRDIGQIMFG